MSEDYSGLDLESFMLDDDDDDSINFLRDFSPSQNDTVFSSNSHPNDDHLRVLKSEFGHSQFKPIQWTVISTVLDNYNQDGSKLKDQCIVMATGFGKSLCYQFIPVYKKSLALVISPLISLMQDQVRLMEMRGIPAVFLGSGQENSSLALNRLYQNEFRLLYISPEYCTNSGPDFICGLHKQIPICLVAIDEAHCVSSWGHDFRPEYGKLSQLREWLPEVPFLALTATASEKVRKDIVSRLSLRNAEIRTSTLNRPNLYFEIQQKSKEIESDMMTLLYFFQGKYLFRGPCIVYCITRRATEQVNGVLYKLGVKCDYYHAGLTPKKRGEIHAQFVRDEIECIVATVAFGMGIDKPDIRLVIHYGAPKEMESYMQEVGRAGRDGLQSKCVVFYSAKDFMILQRIVLTGLDWNESLKEHRSKMMQKMEKFLRSNRCRRQQLLNHFDENYDPNIDDASIRCCDVCTTDSQEKKEGLHKLNIDKTLDFTDEAKLLLGSIQCRDGKAGVGQHARMLTASTQTPDWLKSNRLFGLGKYRNYKWWMDFGKLLQYEGFLDSKPISHGYGNTVALTDRAKEFLTNVNNHNPDFVKLIPTPEMNKATSHPTFPSVTKPIPTKVLSHKVVQNNTNAIYQGSLLLPRVLSEASYELVRVGGIPSQDELTPEQEDMQENLYLRLISIRANLAAKLDCAPYMICGNKLATNLATLRPSNLENLKKIDGVSDVFCKKYGDDFIQEIKNFCRENPDFKTDYYARPQASNERSPLKKRIVANPSLYGMDLIVYERYSKDMLSVEDICKHYSLTSDIVHASLTQALDAGYLVDYKKLGLDEGIEKLVLDVVKAPPINSDLTKTVHIKSLLKHLPEWMIDMSLALIRMTFGVNQSPPLQSTSQQDLNTSQTSQTKLPDMKRSNSNVSTTSFNSLIPQNKLPMNRSSSNISMDKSPSIQKLTSQNSFCTVSEEVNVIPSRPKKRKLPAWL